MKVSGGHEVVVGDDQVEGLSIEVAGKVARLGLHAILLALRPGIVDALISLRSEEEAEVGQVEEEDGELGVAVELVNDTKESEEGGRKGR